MHKLLVLLVLINFTCNKEEVESDQIVGQVQGINLLEDETLSLFVKKGGTAEYVLEDGVLTGIADKDIPNTFLTTKEQYEDFVLSFSVKVDPRLNSGVQIRSLPFMDDNGYEMLTGYQVEIDPSERAWSGGIYEERGRGWIGNLADNPKGRKAFKNGEWNEYFVVAKGKQIQVWVNGICTVNLLDSLGTQGHIGFQVHAIYDDEHVGATVQWKDVLFYPNPTFSRMLSQEEKALEINLLPNQLSDYEKKAGWQLYDIRKDARPQGELRNWFLGENCLCAEGENMADLKLPRPGDKFEVKFEYTIEKSGSALFVYEQDVNRNDGNNFVLADDKNLPEGTNENQKAGSIDGKHAASNLSTPGKGKALRSNTQWSQAKVKVTERRLQHWLNQNLVIELDSGFVNEAEFPTLMKFVNSGSEVCVRSIKYRGLNY